MKTGNLPLHNEGHWAKLHHTFQDEWDDFQLEQNTKLPLAVLEDKQKLNVDSFVENGHCVSFTYWITLALDVF